jgi:branched-chain amino acid transport system ATP-binding protein
MDNSPLLSVESLSVSYDGLSALTDVSVVVKQREMVCVVGANGAGKTSLIRSIAGIVPSRSGVVRWRGRDISRLPSWEICELGIAQVAEGRQIFPALSVLDNLLISGSLKRAQKRRAENVERVYELFPRLRERQRQAAGTLSGGEQQMLAIGRAIMSLPELVMFDEPSVGLSPGLTQVMFDVIKAMHDQGVTVLLVEQNVAQSLKLSNRGYVFENGSVVLEGSGDSLLSNDLVRRAYLGL